MGAGHCFIGANAIAKSMSWWEGSCAGGGHEYADDHERRRQNDDGRAVGE